MYSSTDMARSRSTPLAPPNGGEKRIPPPVKPKPATLVSRPSQDNVLGLDNSAPVYNIASRPSVSRANSIGAKNIASTTTSSNLNNDSGIESTSASFGDLKKAFERNPNMSPLFQQQLQQQQSNSQTSPSLSWRASTPVTPTRFQSVTPTAGTVAGVGTTTSSSSSTTATARSASLRVPPGVAGSRPRSVSTPAPPMPLQKPTTTSQYQPHRDSDNQNSGGDKEGIDNRQPDFSNLRARFQNQASLSSSSTSSTPAKPKPKPAIVAKPMGILPATPTSPLSTFGDSGNNNAGGDATASGVINRLPKPSAALVSALTPTPTSPPSLSTSSTRSHLLSHLSTQEPGSLRAPSPKLSSSTGVQATRQAPRPPPPPITRAARSSSVSKPPISASAIMPVRTPTPPKAIEPTPVTVVAAAATAAATTTELEDEDDEKNPFMGSDEDELAAATAAEAEAVFPPPTPLRMSVVSPPMPPFAGPPPARPVGSAAFNNALNRAKVISPPQRAPPRPISPSGAPPKLPKRSSSSGSNLTRSPTPDTPEEAERKHRLDKRRRVVQELLETEISYSKDMMLLQEVYVTDMRESSYFTQADEKAVFSNLDEIISLTIDFIALLTSACGGLIEEGNEHEYKDSETFVGKAFKQEMSNIRRIFSEYCKRHDGATAHLQELQSKKDLQLFFDLCKEKCRGKSTAWDLPSMLIKPVQRVLKYPLLINQIYALTPSDHPDYAALAEVQKEIHAVAEEINEIKKRKDIVEKIVGSKKKNDSDVVHGFNKKFARTAQQLRQAVGGSEVTVDILFEALLEKFNLQQRLIRDFAKYIQAWLVSMKQYFDNQEAMATTLLEVYNLIPIYANDESEACSRVKQYHQELSQFSRTIGRELESQLKKTVYKSIENFLKLYSGPLQVMKKREKKLLDYDRVREAKDRGDTIDKHMEDSAAAYTAINAQLIEELPKFMGLMTQYFDRIVMEFAKIQAFFYEKVQAKLLSFYIAHIDGSVARSSPGDLGIYLQDQKARIFEEYEKAMRRTNGGVEKLLQVHLLRNVAAAHELAFQDIRDNAAQRRQRSSSVSSPPPPPRLPSRTGSTVSSSSMSTIKKAGSPSSSQLQLNDSMPRFFPSAYENPFEIESVFNDDTNSSVGDADDFGFSSNTRPSTMMTAGSTMDLFGGLNESTSSFGSSSTSRAGVSSGGTLTKPPQLDDGMDDDEIGLAQALFECTAIYPHQGEDARELTFVPGESIVVFGLNDNGWWFGKKVGKETKGWFPASHCIQI